MVHIPKIHDYLEILTDEEVKDFVAINFSEYFKSTKEKLYFRLNKKRNLRKVAKSLYTSLKTSDEVDPELQLKDTESAIKKKK